MSSDAEMDYNFSYNSDLDAFDLYHLVREESGGGRSSGNGPILPALGHAMAGAIAAAIAKATVYPIDTVTTRLQVQKQFRGKKEAPSAASDADAEYRSLPDAIRKIYRNEGGLSAFYSGCLTEVTKGIVDSFCFFLAYTAVRDRMVKSAGTKRLPVHKELSVGVIAGCFSKAITSPIQNVVTRQQTAALIAARNPSELGSSGKPSVRNIIAQIRDEKGLAGFWSGYSAAVILTLNPAITFAAENMLKRLIPKSRRENPTAYQTFLLAALSKVIATTITYPVTLAKSRAMASTSSDDKGSGSSDTKGSGVAASVIKRNLRRFLQLIQGYVTLFSSLQKVYRTEGIKGLYSGLEGDIIKGFLQHGLTMMVKENVHSNVVQLYYTLLKTTKRWPEGLDAARINAAPSIKGTLEQAQNVGSSVAEGARNLVEKVKPS